ncbi:hypothetical protein BOTCAL_0029g00160 [Botryotinia calthae]|uniref:Uncharacterized protein n=1 Tax=Botryotinia calthae TaxID=38488 RepID=A0A4Y8DDW0_9HELO|nr:hypothetical protein BOTCAL_0029g00160 [Botryotinia calthae]
MLQLESYVQKEMSSNVTEKLFREVTEEDGAFEIVEISSCGEEQRSNKQINGKGIVFSMSQVSGSNGISS